MQHTPYVLAMKYCEMSELCDCTIWFLDSAREIMKYQAVDVVADPKNNPQTEQVMHMKLFRAQRNLYISGFALFLLM